VFILEPFKMACFHTLSEVFILKGLTAPREFRLSCAFAYEEKLWSGMKKRQQALAFGFWGTLFPDTNSS
jgi:hypothetical protein